MADETYHRIGSRIWLEGWDDDTMLVAFYLLTNEHRTTEGIYRLPLAYGAADRGWGMKRFRKAFDKLVTDGFIEYDEDAQVVLIVNALKWQQPANPNQCVYAVKKLKALPPTGLLERFEVLARTLAPRLAEHIDKESPEVFA